MKSAIKKKRKLNKREAFLIAAVLIIALILLVWQTDGRNLHQEIVRLSENNSSLNAEITSLEEILLRKNSIERNLAHMLADEARLNVLLPEISLLTNTLGELENIVEYYENQITSFQVGEIESNEGYISLPFTLNAEGAPNRITAIIKTLEAFPQLLIIDYLRWTTIDSKNAAIDINFRIYFYNNQERGY